MRKGEEMRYVVIGIADTKAPHIADEARRAIERARVFSGGRRHHEAVGHMLPAGAQWIDITAPIDEVFDRYKASGAKEIVVFASGDPLFYGFASTIRKREPEAELVVYPTFNSLQTLAHRLLMAYQDMRMVSLTGRPWHSLDRALIEGCRKIGVLTDGRHSPAEVAARLLAYGYEGYTIYIGERLGGEGERVSRKTLEEAARYDAQKPNCIILAGEPKRRRWGIDEAEFETLEGRPGMITKKAVRLLTLQALDLYSHDILVDIGACTGSVSIEARLLFPHIAAVAIERREECRRIIAANAKHFGAPGIETIIGDYNEFCLESIDDIYHRMTGREGRARKAFFIGGHGGRLADIMRKTAAGMEKGDIMVMNSVAEASRTTFELTVRKEGLVMEKPTVASIDGHNTISIMKCGKN